MSKSMWTGQQPRGLLKTVILASAMFAGAQQASAAEEAHGSVNCLTFSQVERTEVLSEELIVFHMRDDRVFRNALPKRCPGLNQNDPFTYTVGTTQLCKNDLITVLQRIGPGAGPDGFVQGASCALGSFEPVSETTR